MSFEFLPWFLTNADMYIELFLYIFSFHHIFSKMLRYDFAIFVYLLSTTYFSKCLHMNLISPIYIDLLSCMFDYNHVFSKMLTYKFDFSYVYQTSAI